MSKKSKSADSAADSSSGANCAQEPGADGFIYLITNEVNGKRYVGKTSRTNPRRRWLEHKRAARLRHVGLLYNALRKYGSDKFTFSVLKHSATLDRDERAAIVSLETHHSLGRGYNLTWGGDGGATRCIPIDKEQLLAYLKQGLTITQIAAGFGVHRDVIRSRIKEYWGVSSYELRRHLGARTPQGKQVRISQEQLKHAIISDQPLGDIYMFLGVTRKVVRTAMQTFWGTTSVKTLRERWGLPRATHNRRHLTGEANGMWGKKHSAETKVKMVAAKRGNSEQQE